MSYTYLQEQGEESSADCYADIPAYVLSRLNLTAGESYSNASGTECSQDSLFGMTCEPLTVSLGGGRSISCVADSHARTLALPEVEQALTVSEVDCGPKWPGSLARFDPHTASWKTRQHLLAGGLAEFSETWPAWGSMRDGELLVVATPAQFIGETEFGFLPTPTATDHKSECMSHKLACKREEMGISAARITEAFHRRRMPTPNAVQGHCNGRLDEWGDKDNPFRGMDIGRLPLNPCFVEQMMNWPIGWTDLQPLATDKFRQWLASHGKHSSERPPHD